MSTNPNRVPAGVSAGGQFATGARAESRQGAKPAAAGLASRDVAIRHVVDGHRPA